MKTGVLSYPPLARALRPNRYRIAALMAAASLLIGGVAATLSWSTVGCPGGEGDCFIGPSFRVFLVVYVLSLVAAASLLLLADRAQRGDQYVRASRTALAGVMVSLVSLVFVAPLLWDLLITLLSEAFLSPPYPGWIPYAQWAILCFLGSGAISFSVAIWALPNTSALVKGARGLVPSEDYFAPVAAAWQSAHGDVNPGTVVAELHHIRTLGLSPREQERAIQELRERVRSSEP